MELNPHPIIPEVERVRGGGAAHDYDVRRLLFKQIPTGKSKHGIRHETYAKDQQKHDGNDFFDFHI